MLRIIPILLLAAALPGAVVLDRIAVVVGNHVIKTSDIDRDLRVTAFLNREQFGVNTDAKHHAAERLIDQEIVRQEILTGGYKQAPQEEGGELVKQLVHSTYGGSQERFHATLARYGLTEDQLRAHLLWQVTVLRFIDQRFRPGVLVTDDEVRDYYQQHLADLRRQYPGLSTLEALQPKIRELLEGERINQAFTQWLEQARRRYHIEYRQEALA